jgi:hypothetical protein
MEFLLTAPQFFSTLASRIFLVSIFPTSKMTPAPAHNNIEPVNHRPLKNTVRDYLDYLLGITTSLHLKTQNSVKVTVQSSSFQELYLNHLKFDFFAMPQRSANFQLEFFLPRDHFRRDEAHETFLGKQNHCCKWSNRKNFNYFNRERGQECDLNEHRVSA